MNEAEAFEKFLKTMKALFSKDNDVDFELFRKFKISLCLEQLINLNAKGAKRSVKTELPTSLGVFSKIFCRLSKIRSVRTYGVR